MRDTEFWQLAGWDTVAARLREVGQELGLKRIRRALVGALYRAAWLYLNRVKATAPRAAADAKIWRRKKWPTKPVHMADAWRAKVVRSEDDEDVAVMASIPRSHYWAVFVEFGTRHMRARPFARPSFSATAAAMMEVLVQFFRERLERAVAKARRIQAPGDQPPSERARDARGRFV
jgi:HK97 gp10 family phage protein